MTDNLDELLANVDDLDDFLREPVKETDDQSEPENLEVSVESEEFSKVVEESSDSSEPAVEPEPGLVPEPAEVQEPPKVSKPGADRDQIMVPGTKEWNSAAPYVISIDSAAFEKESRQLSNIFFFVDSPASQPPDEDIIKKALIDYMRKPDRDLLDKYKVFLYQELLKELLEINTLFLDKGSDEKQLFYHIGPLTIEKILIAKFKHEKRGYCFCYSGSGKGVRIFPEETAKSVIINWFNENIFSASIDFDNITHYDRIKRKVNEIYREDRKKFHTLLEKVNSRAGKGRSVTSARFLALKGDDIFGAIKLQVYRRFIGSSIFL